MNITYMSFENISLEIITENDKLKRIEFVKSYKETTGDDSFQKEIKKELLEYFEGKRKEFDIPLEVEGTEFQKKVWTEMAKIPFGETMSYGELAEKIGKERAYIAKIEQSKTDLQISNFVQIINALGLSLKVG